VKRLGGFPPFHFCHLAICSFLSGDGVQKAGSSPASGVQEAFG